jgi:hypothetical protein
MNTVKKERVLSSKTRNSLNKHTETENGFTEKQLRELQEMLAKYDSDFSTVSEYEKNFLTLRAHAPVVPSEHTLELKKKTRKFSFNAVLKFCFQRKPKIEVNLDDFSSVHSEEINVCKLKSFAFLIVKSYFFQYHFIFRISHHPTSRKHFSRLHLLSTINLLMEMKQSISKKGKKREKDHNTRPPSTNTPI